MSVCSKFDVVIVGGGPAGTAAALWCDELGLSSCLLERNDARGGQLAWIHNPIHNYPGAEFRDGAECLARLEDSLADRRFEFFSNIAVFSIQPETHSVVTSAGAFSGEAIVIATGVRRRELGVPGEAEFHGKGILESGSRDRQLVRGLDVAVIGGGDAALENALILAEFANKVYLIHRRDQFTARKEFVEAVTVSSNIEIILNANVERFGGDTDLEFLDLIPMDGSSRRLPIAKAIVRIGVVPNSELLGDIAEMDERGYVKIDHLGRTSGKGIFAVSDVANPVSPTLSTAVGSAATAVKSIAAFVRTSE